jgi:hypothetical protein
VRASAQLIGDHQLRDWLAAELQINEEDASVAGPVMRTTLTEKWSRVAKRHASRSAQLSGRSSGQNSCKRKGFLEMTAKECEAAQQKAHTG